MYKDFRIKQKVINWGRARSVIVCILGYGGITVRNLSTKCTLARKINSKIA